MEAGQLLLKSGLLNNAQLMTVRESNGGGVSVIDRAVELGFVREDEALKTIGSEVGLDFVDLGQEVVELELSAREAFLDTEFEEAATDLMIDLSIAGDARILWIKEFSLKNQLVEENVVGALNSNLAFFQGLSTGGEDMGLSDQDMLRDVWAQEEDIRRSTEDWLYSYLMTAYHTLDDEELDAYLEMTQTAEGRALTRALFAGFDSVFVSISHDLGAAAARYLASEEL